MAHPFALAPGPQTPCFCRGENEIPGPLVYALQRPPTLKVLVCGPSLPVPDPFVGDHSSYNRPPASHSISFPEFPFDRRLRLSGWYLAVHCQNKAQDDQREYTAASHIADRSSLFGCHMCTWVKAGSAVRTGNRECGTGHGFQKDLTIRRPVAKKKGRCANC